MKQIHEPLPRGVKYLIGIDPDIDKSGFAIWDTVTRKIIAYDKLSFHELITTIPRGYLSTEAAIFVEAGWLNKISNYHKVTSAKGENYKRAVGESIARKVGENHAAGKLLVQCFKCMGYSVTIVQPVSAKWKPEDLKQFTGINTRNQEIIDAIRLVFGR